MEKKIREDLTYCEMIMMKELLSERGGIVSRDRLSMAAFGEVFNKHNRRIDVRISRLRKKLPLNQDGKSKIKSVSGEGYAYIDDDWLSQHLGQLG
ncbi:helix-turn-helix domain-containing protein [uncultured Shewanella sp.]|uniref:helix-turn-helix domain-containing protein n=1 Tax=uncultured Shewanella sp. TaxID=173975 RepID=UPI0026247B48|nr:helix-turn-helix domain-containing protein [uncultured Shewanella sp.]